MTPPRFLLAAALILTATALPAEEAADTFNSLYGDEMKRALATPGTGDDLALAAKLLRAARQAETEPGLVPLLCGKAYELAVKDPSGYPSALAAMRLLAAKVPAMKVQALVWSVAVRQRQYGQARGEDRAKAADALIDAHRQLAQAQDEAGDGDAAAASLRQALLVAASNRPEARPAIQAQLADMVARNQSARQLAALKARVEANPKDAASRKELVRMCLVDLDDPAQAASFVDEGLDASLRRYVPAAARGVDAAPELACVELGDWYRNLVDQATTSAAKAAVLTRARAYYNRFLTLHTAEDPARGAAAAALKKVEDDLAALGPAAKAVKQRRLLILTLAKGIGHKSTPLAAKTLQETGRKTGAFEATVSEEPGVFNAPFLSKFDAVCLANASGDLCPDETSRKALLDFVRGGKGLVAIHAAIAACPEWPEYAEMLGAAFSASPLKQGSVKLDDPSSPINAAFAGKGFEVSDELYSLKDPYSRATVHVLLSLDFENSGVRTRARGMRADNDYALSWIKTCGQGRVFCTALGHDDSNFTNPAILGHILAGIRFALGDLAADTMPSAKLALRPARGPVSASERDAPGPPARGR